MQVIDLYNDTENSIQKRFSGATLPDFVKEAADVTKETLDDHDFGLVLLGEDGVKDRRYPINDPGNTFLSTAYLLECGSSLPKDIQKVAATRIATACLHHDIKPPEPLAKLAGERLPSPYVPKPTDDLGQVVSGPEKLASLGNELFSRNKENMSPEQKRQLSIGMVKVASVHGQSVSEEVANYASSNYAPVLKIHAAIERRREFLPDGSDDFFKKLTAIEDQLGQVPPVAFSSMLTSFDKEAALDFRYNDGVPDPMASTYGSTPESDWSWSNGETRITERQLTTYAHRTTEVKKTLRPSLAEALSRTPIPTFEALPPAQQVIVARAALEGYSEVPMLGA